MNTPFHNHFGRKLNTPLSNMNTVPQSSSLLNEQILNPFLDADTIPDDDYLDDNRWLNGERSDILIEEAMKRTEIDAGRRYNSDKNKTVCRFILHPKLINPNRQWETSLKLLLARDVTKQSKRNLRGFCDTLAPESTVKRTSPTTIVFREPRVPEVTVRNSDVAKFGTKAKQNTYLWQYAQRRPLQYDKTTEETIAAHPKESKNKYCGDVKNRKQASR